MNIEVKKLDSKKYMAGITVSETDKNKECGRELQLYCNMTEKQKDELEILHASFKLLTNEMKQCTYVDTAYVYLKKCGCINTNILNPTAEELTEEIKSYTEIIMIDHVKDLDKYFDNITSVQKFKGLSTLEMLNKFLSIHLLRRDQVAILYIVSDLFNLDSEFMFRYVCTRLVRNIERSSDKVRYIKFMIGKVVKHIDGEEYFVIGRGVDSAEREELIFYKSTSKDNDKIYKIFYTEFMAKVDKEKYPNCEQEYVFELKEYRKIITEDLKGKIARDIEGTEYEIIDVATDSDTYKEYVIYRPLYEEFGIFVLPYESFIAELNKEIYPDSEQKYRFEIRP